MKVSAGLFFDTRREKKTGYPVKIAIYFDRSSKKYSSGVDATEADWKKINSVNPGKCKDSKDKLEKKLARATEIIESLDEDFSYSAFEQLWLKKAQPNSDIKSCFDAYVEKLVAAGKKGTSVNYEVAFRSLLSFKKNISWPDITPKFLEDYEKWMIKNGRSKATIGIYTRNLRTTYNLAIKDKILKQSAYPFGGDNYTPFTGKSKRSKKVYQSDDLKKIIEYAGDLERSRDFWVLSYLSNGANIKDIIHWKESDIKDGKITFLRKKVEDTKEDQEPIIFMLSPKIQEIISKWGVKGGDYIFPILTKDTTPSQEYYKRQDFVALINKDMKTICEELKIPKVTTYWARHAFSMMLKRKGVDTAIISEALGHGNLETTKAYLGSFEDDVYTDISSKLLDF